MNAKLVGFTVLGLAVGALAAGLILQGRLGAQGHVRVQKAPNISVGAGEIIFDMVAGTCVITSKTSQIYARPGLSIRIYVVNYCTDPRTVGIYFPSTNPLTAVPSEITVPAISGNTPGKGEILGTVRGNATRNTYQYGFTLGGTQLPASDPDIIIDEWR